MQYPRLVLGAAGLVISLAITSALAAPRHHAQAAAACWQGLAKAQAAKARMACDAALQSGDGGTSDLLRAGHADWLAGDRDAALARYRQALATHPDAAAWQQGPMRELARLIASGRPRAATWREARDWLDGGRHTLAQARADFAAAHQLAHDKQPEAALPLAQRAFDGVDRLLEWSSPDRLAALDQLLSLQERTFRYEELLALSRTQLARIAAAGDLDAELQDRIAGGEAAALQGLGRYQEAAEAWQHAIELAERLDGAEDPDLVWLLNARAEALLDAGDAAAARQLLTRSIGLLGPKATIRVAAETFGLLARCMQAQGLPDDALLAARNGLQLANHVAGEDPAAPLHALAQLADVQAAQAHHAEAISLNRQVVAMAESTLGAAHPFTSLRMERFALALSAGGQPVGATMWLERSLELGERTLGPRHPETVARRERLAEWKRAAGEPGDDPVPAS